MQLCKGIRSHTSHWNLKGCVYRKENSSHLVLFGIAMCVELNQLNVDKDIGFHHRQTSVVVFPWGDWPLK